MSADYVFHIRNANPEDMTAALATLEAFPDLLTTAQVVESAAALGYAVQDKKRFEALMTARDLGLVAPARYVLTDEGLALFRITKDKPSLFADIMHGLHYILWRKSHPANNCFSWSYRAICQWLWHAGSAGISNVRRTIASEIESQACSAFMLPNVAVSPKTVGGAFLWFVQLQPSVIDPIHQEFRRRTFCPPELAILGVDFLYRDRETEYGTNLRLTDENQEEICKVCLIDPHSFDRVLEYTLAQFDFLEKGTGGGWGRYLRLNRPPKLEDFI